MSSESHEIRYSELAAKDLRSMRKFDQRKIIEAIETHLTTEPAKESKSRVKKMKQPTWSQFRLRVDDFRVYDDVDSAEQKVNILRILEKGRKETPKEEK